MTPSMEDLEDLADWKKRLPRKRLSAAIWCPESPSCWTELTGKNCSARKERSTTLTTCVGAFNRRPQLHDLYALSTLVEQFSDARRLSKRARARERTCFGYPRPT